MSYLLAWLILCASCSTLYAEQARRIVVIAHRGEHLHHPENTLPAFQAAIEAGADFFELDVRTTADGKFVLMHDGTVNRTTNGEGAVAKMTLSQIAELDAGIRSGPGFVHTSVPRLDEALALAKDKIGVYVDSKAISAADVVAAIERAQMQDHAVIYGGVAYLTEIHTLRPAWRVMPEANNPTVLRNMLQALSLRVVAFDARDFQAETIAMAKAAKADIYVDRLGPADNQTTWQDAIDRGATGIQTDHPAELAAYLKSRGYR